MEPASRTFRGDLAFAQKQKLYHVTKKGRDLSPTREETGTRRARQAIDPRWDPYSGEITSSDKGKPQSVKPKTFGITLRHVDAGRENTGDLKTPNPVGEHIRKLNRISSAEKLEVKDTIYSTSIPSTSTSPSNSEILSPQSLPRHEISTETTMVQSTSKLTLNISKSPVSKTQLDVVEASPEMSISIKTNPTSIIVSKPASVEPGDSNNEHEDEDEDAEKKKPAVIQSGLPSIIKAEIDDKQTSKKQLPSTRSDQTNPIIIAESEFQKKPTQSSHINSYNTDHTVLAPKLKHITINTSENTKLLSRSSDDRGDEPLIKSRALAQQESLTTKCALPKETAFKPHQIIRKAVPPRSPIFISMSTNSVMDVKERHLNSKSLPQTPSENSSNDLVSALQAHLDSLAHRRKNITRSIRQMTELMPVDNLLITEDVRLKRENEKRKVAMLREEEAEIKREEHEVGLRLHRAWKRTESGAVYEPTSLWVRRVTGVGKNWCWPNQDLPVC